MDYFSSDFTLGILGGGQLGKMLLYQTQKYDIKTAILDPSKDAPAITACNRFVQGNLMDFDTVYKFGQSVDIITTEIEHINTNALKQLALEGKKVYPTANTLSLIQNKNTQKQFYQQHHIPTATFEYFTERPSLDQVNIPLPFVWKQTQFGYDGYGVKVIRCANDFNQLPSEACIIEEMVDFRCELAVIVARSASGEISTYPVVEMDFHPEANQVTYVLCPARIDDILSNRAQELAKKIVSTLDYIGLIAVEMFVTNDNEILVNEIAPRPHNSGHYTIEASYTDQFEQHLRAILDLPLGNTDSKIAAVMVNLVGEEGYHGQAHYQNMKKIMTLSGVSPHIYGKRETRPFRKMGHVTIVHPKLEIALQIAREVRDTIKVVSQ